MKNSYYFPHDYHARHDPKLERLRMVMGCEGVGIYWCLVEMLYEEGGSLELKDIEIYAKALNTTADNIQKTLSDFNLFVKNETHFYSSPLLKRLKHINLKREKARASAKLSHSANAQRTHSERSAIKESKVKEIKDSIVNSNSPDFLTSLKTNPAYAHINIDTELGKMDAWLLAHPGRQKTKKFIVNWLNKIEKPLSIIKPKEPVIYKAPLESERFNFIPDTKKLIKELADKKSV